MASSVASESILFIGAVIAATAFAGVMTGVANNLASDVRADAQAEADATRSDVTIINDPASVIQSPDLILHVKNTGRVSVDPSTLVLMVDGVLVTGITYDVVGSTDDTRLAPGQVLTLTANAGLGAGDHRARVVTGTGASDDFAWSG